MRVAGVVVLAHVALARASNRTAARRALRGDAAALAPDGDKFGAVWRPCPNFQSSYAGAWYAHAALVARAAFHNRNALEFASRELFNAVRARPPRVVVPAPGVARARVSLTRAAFDGRRA